MKVLKIKKVQLKNPVPVYDATSPKYHNYVLANRCVVHNTAKQANFPNQAILPLKGKIKNAIKAKENSKTGSALESEEVTHVLGAIGFDPKATDPYEKLQTSKIILLADPDPDGWHINTLLLTLFYRYLPRLFDLGMVYVSVNPEFYAIHKGVVYYGFTLSEVQSKIKKAGAPASLDIQHIKGWGEISVPLMKMLALAPETRTLVQIKPISPEDSDFDLLMNDDTEFRKKLLGIA